MRVCPVRHLTPQANVFSQALDDAPTSYTTQVWHLANNRDVCQNFLGSDTRWHYALDAAAQRSTSTTPNHQKVAVAYASGVVRGLQRILKGLSKTASPGLRLSGRRNTPNATKKTTPALPAALSSVNPGNAHSSAPSALNAEKNPTNELLPWFPFTEL